MRNISCSPDYIHVVYGIFDSVVGNKWVVWWWHFTK